MAAEGLTFAEEIIDLQTISQLFQGEIYPLTSGRVLLHATRAGRGVVCGRERDGLLGLHQAWDAAYLPHLGRCRACLAALDEPGGDWPDHRPPELPAQMVDVRSLNGTEEEEAGVQALRAVLGEYDLRRWMCTDLVLVNERIKGGVSHPLMICPELLTRRPQCALTTFMHEEMHWIQGPGLDAATTEVSKRWPGPPPPPAGGRDAESTWLHLIVCTLEYQSLAELLGAAAAQAELRQHNGYAWIYDQIFAEPEWFAGLLTRHGVAIPERPPVPRRYYGEDWWKDIVEPATN
jgi:hypothetical protein